MQLTTFWEFMVVFDWCGLANMIFLNLTVAAE
jgi:hypothetical protein